MLLAKAAVRGRLDGAKEDGVVVRSFGCVGDLADGYDMKKLAGVRGKKLRVEAEIASLRFVGDAMQDIAIELTLGDTVIEVPD
jgi:hypothetical protein